jgi:hypothetical protein
MNDFWSQVVMQIVATAIGFFCSSYYFMRSINRKMSPFICQTSKVKIQDMLDPRFQKDVVLKYNNDDVHSLYELKLIFKNTGDMSICKCNIFEPLLVRFSKKCKFLAAEIGDIYPEGRKVRRKQGKDSVEVNFNVLNKGEYFEVKLLFGNEVSLDDLSISIEAENLPPVLFPEPVAHDMVNANKKHRANMPALSLGAILAVCSIIVLAPYYYFFNAVYYMFPYFYFSGLMISTFTSGLILIVGSFFHINFPYSKYRPFPKYDAVAKNSGMRHKKTIGS